MDDDLDFSIAYLEELRPSNEDKVSRIKRLKNAGKGVFEMHTYEPYAKGFNFLPAFTGVVVGGMVALSPDFGILAGSLVSVFMYVFLISTQIIMLFFDLLRNPELSSLQLSCNSLKNKHLMRGLLERDLDNSLLSVIIDSKLALGESEETLTEWLNLVSNALDLRPDLPVEYLPLVNEHIHDLVSKMVHQLSIDAAERREIENVKRESLLSQAYVDSEIVYEGALITLGIPETLEVKPLSKVLSNKMAVMGSQKGGVNAALHGSTAALSCPSSNPCISCVSDSIHNKAFD